MFRRAQLRHHFGEFFLIALGALFHREPLVPGVEVIHKLMPEPEGPVVRVILRLALDVLHRIGARHFSATRTDHGIEVRFVRLGIARHIFREELTIDLDDDSVGLLLDGEIGRREG